MSDRANQEVYRRVTQGDLEARAELLRRRLRVGECSLGALELAAVLGHDPAREALDHAVRPKRTKYVWQDPAWILALRTDLARDLAFAAGRAVAEVLPSWSPFRALLGLLDSADDTYARGFVLDDAFAGRVAEAAERAARSLGGDDFDGPSWSVLTLARGELFRESFLREVAAQRGSPQRKVHDLWVIADNAAYYDDILGWVLSEGELTGSLAWVHLTYGVQGRLSEFPWTTVISPRYLCEGYPADRAAALAISMALAPATLNHCPALNALAACCCAAAALKPSALQETLRRDFLPLLLEGRGDLGLAGRPSSSREPVSPTRDPAG